MDKLNELTKQQKDDEKIFFRHDATRKSKRNFK